MQARNGLFLKPMLPLTKAQIDEYMSYNGHSWMEDSSNAERKYKRNEVRLDLVPLLQSLAGGERALYTRVQDISDQSEELRLWLEAEVTECLLYCF